MIPFIGPLISGIFGIGQTYLSNKAEEKQALHTQKITKIKQDGNWDEIQAKNSGNSWKDEFISIVLFAPFITMFISAALGWDEVVEQHARAFEVIKTQIPSEYWYLLGVVVAASFGVKKVIDGIQSFRNKK